MQLWQSWHELVGEPGNTATLADALEWLDARTEALNGARHDSSGLVRALREQAEADLQRLAKERPDLMARFERSRAELAADRVLAPPGGGAPGAQAREA